MISYEPLVNTMKEKGTDMDKLSKATGLKKSFLITRMNGGVYLPLEYIDRICTALEVPVEAVIKWKAGEQKHSERVRVNWSKVSAYAERERISLNALDEKCRLCRGAMSRAKCRGSSLNAQVALSLAKALNCKVEDLI